jgi:DNA helicase HerA-like ATPase
MVEILSITSLESRSTNDSSRSSSFSHSHSHSHSQSIPSPVCLAREKMVVLVSPTFYQQRKHFYGDYCIVKPLLFDWNSLTADHIRRLMKLTDSDNQLYISSLLELLRGYQRRGKVPEYSSFIAEVKEMCQLPGQSAALTQRINIIESIIKQSEQNKSILEESTDVKTESKTGMLIVVDLTDPLLSSSDVNSIFQVLTEQFRSLREVKGKLLVLDEAHRYMDGEKEDGLSKAIVDVARLMRHDGMRLAISTQSPKVLAPELLELITAVVMHRFHSKDWMEYLSTKLGLEEDFMEKLFMLEPGEAMLFTSRNLIDVNEKVFRIDIRPRITADRGASVRNFPTNKTERGV